MMNPIVDGKTSCAGGCRRGFGKFAAVAASAFCLAGGLWLVSHSGTDKDSVFTLAVGLYFIGKACFVGPMLWLTACGQSCGCKSGGCGKPEQLAG